MPSPEVNFVKRCALHTHLGYDEISFSDTSYLNLLRKEYGVDYAFRSLIPHFIPIETKTLMFQY
jgi:hypothetical protein